MKLQEIIIGLKNGTLMRSGSRVYPIDDWDKIDEAEKEAEHYDLLQLTKKIQL